MSVRNSFCRTLCGDCQLLFEQSVTYSLTRLQPPEKCTCQNCKKEATCVSCRIDELPERPDRNEPHDDRALGAR